MLHSPSSAALPRRRTQVGYAFGLILAVVAVVFAFGGGRAKAAVFPVPTPPHNIFVLPTQDAITTVQNPNTAVTVNVLRAGVVVGSASGTTDFQGNFQVNHPGGVCFIGSTPLLQPQDVVQVVTAAGGEQTTVQNVTAGPITNVGGVITIHGTAADAAGAPIPLAQMDVRIISKILFAVNGRRDIRAGGPVGPTGTLTYDTPGGTAWTAAWPTLSAGDQALAMAGAARADWLGADPAAGNEGTIYDVGVVPFPIPECLATAPLSAFSVTGTSHTLYNVASAAAGPLVINGTAANAGAPTVTLDDANPATPAVTVTPVMTGGLFAATWTATFTPAQVASLTDGVITATGTFTDAAGNVVPGGSISVTKDTTAPLASTVTNAGGVFLGAQTVAIANADPTAALRFTIGTPPAAPTAASPLVPAGGVPVPSGTVSISVIAIDPAGNAGPVATFGSYRIVSVAGTATDHPTVTLATQGTPVVISGTAVNAPGVSVSLDDANLATPTVTVPATLTGTLATQTWSASFTPAQVQALSDGTLTAKALVGTAVGGTVSMIKDTVAPPAPTPSLAPGTYQNPRTLVLSDAEVGTAIHYVLNGVALPSSPTLLAGDLINLPEGTSTVSALAVDPLGNPSAVGSFTYTIVLGTTASPATASVGSAVVQQTSGTATYTLTNTSPRLVTYQGAVLGGANSTDFSVTGGTCAGTLPAGGSCTVTVAMTPSAPGLRSATLTLSDSSPTSPHVVNVTGSGIAQTFSIAADTTLVDFLKVPTGSVTGERLVTVTSTGNTAVTVNPPTIVGANANQFAITSNTCGPLKPGASCQIGVLFAPTVKANAAATLSIAATQSATSVALKGVGDKPLPAPLPPPPAPGVPPTPPPGVPPTFTVSLSPTTLQFNKVVLNTTATQTVTVTSTGTGSTLVNPTLGGANANQYTLGSDCPASLAPGASCTLTLTFHPTVRANANASITVTGPTVSSVVTVKGSVK